MIHSYIEKRYSADGDYDTGLLRGRFNPPGNHHLAVMDRVVERNEVDTLYVIVEEPSRSARNPLSGEQVADVLTQCIADRDIPYNVDIDTRPIKGGQDAMWENMTDILEKEPVYYTAEPEQAVVAELRCGYLNQRYDGAYDFGIDYEPRDRCELDYPDEMVDSATTIKQLIHAEDPSWRRYVPDDVEVLLDVDPDAVDHIRSGDPDGAGKHLDIFL